MLKAIELFSAFMLIKQVNIVAEVQNEFVWKLPKTNWIPIFLLSLTEYFWLGWVIQDKRTLA